jgi:NAD(P)-dependent dehydrogenase (short-subunit alcohol dehydrogenase family)
MSSKKTIRIFNGATAIVTGGASGIGRAFAKELAKRGCEVVLADQQIQLAEEVASEICALGGKSSAREVDVILLYRRGGRYFGGSTAFSRALE